MTPQKLVEELDKTVSLPGIANVWVPPVRNRLDMLATGIKSPVGIKVNGNNIADIERVARQIEQVVKDVPRRLLCAGGASGRRTLRGYSYRSAKSRALRRFRR